MKSVISIVFTIDSARHNLSVSDTGSHGIPYGLVGGIYFSIAGAINNRQP